MVEAKAKIEPGYKRPVLDKTDELVMGCLFCKKLYNGMKSWMWQEYTYLDCTNDEHIIRIRRMVHINCLRGDMMYHPLSEEELKRAFADRNKVRDLGFRH